MQLYNTQSAFPHVILFVAHKISVGMPKKLWLSSNCTVEKTKGQVFKWLFKCFNGRTAGKC